MPKSSDVKDLIPVSSGGRETFNPAPPHQGNIRIGVSACVIGKEVRFNGGHKRSFFVQEELGQHVEFMPVCPEVEMGLSVPRETLRLVRRGEEVALVTSKGGTDYTQRMEAFARERVAKIAELDLCGFIVQKGSPSCGMERVKAYPPDGGMPTRDQAGLFTRELMRRLPHLPIEEDGRLNDPLLREHFIERIFAYRRLRDLFETDWRPRDLIAFHSREKLLVLAHSDYRPLGRVVANRNAYSQEEWGLEYQRLFLAALARPASIKRHVNVLQHLAGYFRNRLDKASRAEVLNLIESYRQKLVPLIAPLTLLRHHARNLDLAYLNVQTYLHPRPQQLLPQNHLP